MQKQELTRDEFLIKKRDFSPLLVHLTRDNGEMSASDVLECILDCSCLVAFNHYCLFSPNLVENNNTELENDFKVVCFTETPIDLIGLLTEDLAARRFKFEPYGLVFQKSYIRIKGGNPVFYATKEVALPLWELYWKILEQGEKLPRYKDICRTLSLVTLCDESSDWHWEREWRVVGNLGFKLDDVYFGLCREEEVSYFQKKYKPIKFIDPYWGINRIIDKLVEKQ